MTIAIRALGAFALATGVTFSAQAFEPESVECIAPANPGGGWDFTCRQVGKTLTDLGIVDGNIQVTNMAGAGGGVAYAYVVADRGDDANLLVAASTATATRLAQNLYVGLTSDQVRFVGSLGADYGVIVVSADSPYQNLDDLVNAIIADPGSVAFGGGSAVGGFDHIKVLQVLQAAGFTDITAVPYVALDGGADAILQVTGGHLGAMTGDITETVPFMEDIRILAVLSEERLPGDFADIPTAVEQGYNVVAPNWRGFYIPLDAGDEAFDFWADAMSTVYESDEWKQIMAENGLMPFYKVGPDFQTFVDEQISAIADLSREIGVIE